MFDLLVDVYALTEATVNGEPADTEGAAPLYANVFASFVRLSGNTRYTAAATGVALTHRMAIDARTGVTERCRVRNVRTREGAAVPAQPDHYEVKYVHRGRRAHHLELDLEAIL
jgi:head-tail adaptor